MTAQANITSWENLPDDASLWNEFGIFSVDGSALSALDGLPYKSAVTLLLAEKISKEDAAKAIAKAEDFNLKTTVVSSFTEAGVQCVVMVNDRYDAEYSHWLKFADWQIDALHAGSLPDMRKVGVILMDMDATCVQCECIDEMAKLAGIGDQVSAVTAQAMRGELDFQQSFRKRVALFEGKSESIMDTVEANLPVMPGFAELVAKAKSYGWKMAIASGGFTRFVGKLKRDFGLDVVEANTIEAIDGVFTGKVLGRIVDSRVKADTLISLREKFGARVRETIAIGDGANDLPMISLAGTGISIHAKPVVREKAPISIVRLNLHSVAAILEAASRLNKFEQ